MITLPAILSVLALGFICWIYAFGIVRKLRQRDPDHGYTAMLVVGGNMLVLASFFITLWLMFGIEAAMVIGVLLFIHFAVAGLPMVAEYTEHHVNTRHAERKAKRDRREIRRIVEDSDDA